MKCYVPGCPNDADGSKEGITFHRIPSDLKNDWLKAIGRHHVYELMRNYRICSEHFAAEDFRFIGDKKILKKDSIPSLKIPLKEYVQFDFTKPLSMRIHNTCDSLPSTSSQENSCTQGTDLISDTPLSTTATSQPNQAISEHRSTEHKRKLPVSSSDSEGLIGTPKKRRKDLRTFHNYCLSPRKMKVKLETRQVVCKSIAKKLKVSKERAKRLSVKVKSLKDVLRVLEKKKIVSDESLMILDKTISGIPAALMRRLVGNLKRGKTSREKFVPELRSFAMTLQFYSSKAYNYVRKIFQLALPSPTVIRNWLSNIDCSPGFIQQALDTLKSKVKDDEKNNIKTVCSLMLDEMSLKKQIEFVGNKTWGYVDIGTGIEDDELKSATEALVLMVVSLNSNWKIPIAYFLINGLSGKEKANLIKQALIILVEINIEIVSITCDGPSAHFTMASELGAKMNISAKSGIQPYFLHPTTHSKVFIIFDACHMLKLMRNNWARLNKIYDRDGNEIDFGYITKLNEIQENLQFRLGNKLRKAHVDWTKQKMKVNLAAQTLSSSVADAIEFLCEDIGHEEFQNAEGTIKFIRTVDKLFDISNSRNVFAKGYKAPLRPSNDLFWSNAITEGIDYLKGLKNAAGTSLYLTKNKTPIKGFIITLTSIMGIYDEYMKPGSSLKYLLTYKLSQDHLELFFYNVRTKNGTNNNPTAFQFNNTFKRLMLHHDLKEGSGNCLSQDDTSILTVTSKRRMVDPVSIDDLGSMKKYGFAEEIVDDHDFGLFVPFLDIVTENSIVYISGFIVKQLKKILKCTKCILVLETVTSNTKDDLTFMLFNRKNRGELIKPSEDIVTIIKFVEVHIKIFLAETNDKLPKQKNFFDKFVLKCYINFVTDGKAVFRSLENHHLDCSTFSENHISRLIKSTIERYAKLRFYAISKKQTEVERGSVIRKQLSRLVLFQNQ